MSTIANIPCKYLVLNTSYTQRLVDSGLMVDYDLYGTMPANKAFGEFCKEYDLEPLYVMAGIPIPVTLVNETIKTDNEISEEERSEINMINQSLTANNLEYDGTVVFRVKSFDHATQAFLHITRIGYCRMYSITMIKFLQNANGEIDTVYVSYDTESG